MCLYIAHIFGDRLKLLQLTTSTAHTPAHTNRLTKAHLAQTSSAVTALGLSGSSEAPWFLVVVGDLDANWYWYFRRRAALSAIETPPPPPRFAAQKEVGLVVTGEESGKETRFLRSFSSCSLRYSLKNYSNKEIELWQQRDQTIDMYSYCAIVGNSGKSELSQSAYHFITLLLHFQSHLHSLENKTSEGWYRGTDTAW